MKANIIMISLTLVVAGTAAGQTHLMVPDSGAGDRIMLFSAADGSLVDINWITDIGAVGWSFTTPKEARVIGNEIWVSDQVTDAIHRFDMDRNFLSSITAHPGGGTLDNIRGFGTDGTNVYVTVFHGTAALRGIAVYTTTGTPLSFFSAGATGSGPFDAEPFQGELLISSAATDNIERWTNAGVFVNNFATGIVFPQQVEILGDGSVITVSSISTPGVEGVYHFNADGTLRRYIDTQPAKNQFGELVPRGAYLLGDGNYLISTDGEVMEYDVTLDNFTQVLTGVNAQYVTPFTPATGCALPGDANGDSVVNGKDVGDFVQCLLGTGGANCPCADMNGGGVNPDDVTPFANALIGA